LRLLEPRRRNSWAVTRKPSQDSNLSSSRNDSSATSNSTATWRLSRSSVSSDATSHSGGGKSSFKRIAAANASTAGMSSTQVTTTATVNRPKNLQTTAASAAAVIASGSSGTILPNTVIQNSSSINPAVNSEDEILVRTASNNKVPLQQLQSVQHDPASGGGQGSNFPRRPSIPKTVRLADPVVKRMGNKKKVGVNKKMAGGPARRSLRKKPDADVIIIDDDEASAKIATNRPRLVRQSAFFSEEVVIEPEVCPVHGPLNPGTYDDEDEEEEQVSDIDELQEEDEEEHVSGEGESDGENSSPTDPILRKPSGQIGIALVIVPRRLSTISSRDTLSVRSREESDLLLNDNASSSSAPHQSSSSNNNILNPSSSSNALMLPSSSSSSSSALLLPPGLGSSYGRRKMSEQPVKFFVVPASSGLINSAKWHSMSSMESAHQSNQQPSQAQFISSPSQSRSQSRSQSPRAFRANMRPEDQRMTTMAEFHEESSQDLPNTTTFDSPSQSNVPDNIDIESSSNNSTRHFGHRDPNERRVSFQLPPVTVAVPTTIKHNTTSDTPKDTSL